MTTLRQARQIVKDLGMTLRVIDGEEYRVAYVPDREASAYYTNDLDDAVGTARAMYAFANPSTGA